MSWDVVLGYLTGLRLLSSTIEPGTLLRTVLVVHVCDSVMCRLLAHNNGYSKNLWTVLGLLFGIWAVAILILLPRRQRGPTRESAAPPAGAGDGGALQDSAIT